MVSPSDSIIFLYLGIAMVNYQMYQWDPVFISVTFFLCLFVRLNNIHNSDGIEESLILQSPLYLAAHVDCQLL